MLKKMNVVVILLVALMLLSSPIRTFADEKTEFEITKVVDHGDDYNKLVFVIMGDGYTESELGTFRADADRLIAGILSESPYNKFKDQINFYEINVISNVSGASDSPNDIKDTYFGSCFNYFGNIQRLIYPTKQEKIRALLQNSHLEYDYGILIVNSEEYGGSGREVVVTSKSAYMTDIVNHELGHVIGGLSDEYFANEEYLIESPNMTKESNLSKVKWKAYLNQHGIGIYPLFGTSGWNIPSEYCKMRELGTPYCYVCGKVMEDAVFKETTKLPKEPVIWMDSSVLTNKDVKIWIESEKYLKNIQYSLDNGRTWSTYSTSFLMTQNGTILAKGQTNDGVWSNVAEETVVTIDKVAPIVEGVADGGVYNSAREIIYSEGLAELNGQPLENSSIVSADGKYSLIIKDEVGNVTNIEFVIDKTAPEIRAKASNGSKVISGRKYKTSSIAVQVKDSNMGDMTVTLNGAKVKYPHKGIFTSKGAYTIVVTDKAGNSKVLKFEIM